MTHAELVERAARWLRTHHRCGTVFAEMVTASGECPDAIGWRMHFSRVVEVKVSRGDFFADRQKLHAAHPDTGMGRQRWYLVPDGLVSVAEVPAWCGLAYATKRRIVIAKEAPDRAVFDHGGEVQMLTSAVRRFTLGSAFDAGRGRFERLEDRLARERAA